MEQWVRNSVEVETEPSQSLLGRRGAENPVGKASFGVGKSCFTGGGQAERGVPEHRKLTPRPTAPPSPARRPCGNPVTLSRALRAPGRNNNDIENNDNNDNNNDDNDNNTTTTTTTNNNHDNNNNDNDNSLTSAQELLPPPLFRLGAAVQVAGYALSTAWFTKIFRIALKSSGESLPSLNAA